MRLEAFMDDVESPDLYFFTNADLAAAIDQQMTRIAKERGQSSSGTHTVTHNSSLHRSHCASARRLQEQAARQPLCAGELGR